MSDEMLIDDLADEPSWEQAGPVLDGLGGGEVQMLDTDDDGTADAFVLNALSGGSVVALNLDDDPQVDGLAIDTDGDGVADVWILQIGNGYQVDVDTDGDGESDQSQTVTREQLETYAPECLEVLDMRFDGQPHVEAVDVVPDDGLVIDGQLVGDPQEASPHWFEQAQNGFCLPASIAQIASLYTGIDYTDESAFVDLANQYGAFSVGMDGVPGIEFSKGAELLGAAGVPATYEFGDMETLADGLSDGRGIIVFVDSGEYWNGESSEDDAPDHAVVVTAIDLQRGTVILSDPGTPGGDREEISIGLFENAWADSDHAMIVCDESAPGQDTMAAPSETLITESDVAAQRGGHEAPDSDVAAQRGGHEAPESTAPLGEDAAKDLQGEPSGATRDGGQRVWDSSTLVTTLRQGGWILLPFLGAVALGRRKS